MTDNKIKAIRELIQFDIENQKDLMRVKRTIAKKFSIPILENSEVIKEYRSLVSQKIISRSPKLERIIRRRSVRTMSGKATDP